MITVTGSFLPGGASRLPEALYFGETMWFTSLSVTLTLAAALAADWPQFRGPNGAGVAVSHNLPRLIAPDQNVLWKIDTPGGHSSPIVVGGRLIITGVEGGERQ